MTRTRLLLALPLVAVLAHPAAAQQSSWRTVDLSRQLRDTLPQRMRVQYGAGQVDVRGSDDALLYAMHLRYDETRAAPLHRYDAEQRSSLLGLESRVSGLRTAAASGESGELRLSLPRRVPLDLELELGGTQATLALGGLALHSLRLECGATEATVDFASANRARMRDIEINVGAAGLRALHLGNANAEQMRVRGGVGAVDLDFGGDWTRDLAVETSLAALLQQGSEVECGARASVRGEAAARDQAAARPIKAAMAAERCSRSTGLERGSSSGATRARRRA